MEQLEMIRSECQVPGVTLFGLKGPFTLATMFDLQAALRDPDLKGVLIDMAEVPYMDSAALGVLLGQWSHAQRVATKFALAGMSGRVRTVFEITHTDQILPIFDTVAEAERALAAMPG